MIKSTIDLGLDFARIYSSLLVLTWCCQATRMKELGSYQGQSGQIQSPCILPSCTKTKLLYDAVGMWIEPI